jgi:dimethylhistidine N-methyltransferase
MGQFLAEVIQDLNQTPKRLNSKYFYDSTGDVLFQRIMGCGEYYLTRCEAEIFEKHGEEIATCLRNGNSDFDLIELGAGDASKTIHLLRALARAKSNFTYVPIDISSSIIQHLETNLTAEIPGLTVKGLNGEYLEMLKKAHRESSRRKVILFLGSNIGNLTPGAALNFCKEIRATLNEGDRLLIGFDLKKHPATILAAYNDASGYTRAFNLNLLHRINRELGGNFIPDQFDHYPTYDPVTGACKSYLVSTVKQEVRIGEQSFAFGKDEVIHMEISQKYSRSEIENMAQEAGFSVAASFTDSRDWFVDSIWSCGAA